MYTLGTDFSNHLACSLWVQAELSMNGDVCCVLVDDLVHIEGTVRLAAAQALAVALEHHPERLTATLYQILKLYQEKNDVCTR